MSNNVSKEIVFISPGVDQLQRSIGTPVPGDIVKLHMKISSISVLGQDTVFVSSRSAGAKAFYEATIPPNTNGPPTSAADIIARMAQTMSLGETARFVVDVPSLDDPIKDFFCDTELLLHQGQEGVMERDAVQLVVELESFRIVRWHGSTTRTQIEHLRQPRNVRAA